MQADIGIVGLGVMGENLALNIAGHGFSVVGLDLDADKRARFAARTGGRRAGVADTPAALVAALAVPRRILMMVPAGAPVDAVIASLQPLLAPGDVLIDGGNSLFGDTARRAASLAAAGVLYVGMGVSGGEEGALRGPALMPGGDERAWPRVQPLLQAIAARAPDGQPCCDWVGPGGAGHFVKMVHNGIEYADMQLICEAYALLRALPDLSAPDMAAVFAEWNRGELASYLIDITATILARIDDETGRPLVDLILDTAEQKGTGKWTSQVALDLGVTAPTIAEAVFARTLSAAKDERVAAAQVLAGPARRFDGDRDAFVERVRRALLVAKVCAYAQGFQILREADRVHGWGLRFGAIAAGWRAGCIIRAALLEPMRVAFAAQPDLPSLLLDTHFARLVERSQQDLREVVATAALHGVAVPALMSALAYLDGYRSAVLPANLLQAQRDCFGAHTYRRVDRAGVFHTIWTAP
jgi:6-phosphogluconate dehydrogenase